MYLECKICSSALSCKKKVSAFTVTYNFKCGLCYYKSQLVFKFKNQKIKDMFLRGESYKIIKNAYSHVDNGEYLIELKHLQSGRVYNCSLIV